MLVKLYKTMNNAQDALTDTLEKGADRLGFHQRSSVDDVAGSAACAVGCIALGAAAMYFLDPTSGRRRRALARDKFTSYFNHQTRRATGKAKDLSNRAKGVVAETRSSLRHLAKDSSKPQDGQP